MGSSESRKKRPYVKAFFWGLFSIGLYAALYLKADAISDYFGKGGMYAFLPIAAAFIFSFAHGNFTGLFWSSLGVEASKKVKEVK